jgi:hypothetical protein
MFQEASNELCHAKFSRMSVGDIEGQSDDLPPSSVQLVRRRHRFVTVSVCDDHLTTDLRQFTGDAETKALGRAGDQRHVTIVPVSTVRFKGGCLRH